MGILSLQSGQEYPHRHEAQRLRLTRSMMHCGGAIQVPPQHCCPMRL